MPLNRFCLLFKHFHFQCFWMFLKKLWLFRNISRLMFDSCHDVSRSPWPSLGGSKSPRILGWGREAFPLTAFKPEAGRLGTLENCRDPATWPPPDLGRALYPLLLGLCPCLPQAFSVLCPLARLLCDQPKEDPRKGIKGLGFRFQCPSGKVLDILEQTSSSLV